MFKFLHTADIHLDSPLLNLNNYDGVDRDSFRSATRRAFDNIVALAIREQVRFVLIAGDLYDGDSKDFQTPIYFRRKMEELQAAGIQVFIVQGNHDAEQLATRAYRLQLPDNVKLFSTSKPETVRLDDLKVAIHGQGFATKAVDEDLSKHYPNPVPGYINIGMLHTNCGSREGHDPYAPSTISGLSAKTYQYWALGHIHKPQTLTGPDPWIIYPGNPQGRHVGETGERGCILATVDGDRIDRKAVAVDVLRWQILSTDVSDCDDAAAVVRQIGQQMVELVEAADGRPLAVRINVSGNTGSHRELVRRPDHWDEEVRDAVVDQFGDRVWIEKIRFRTSPPKRAVAATTEYDKLISELSDPTLAESARSELRTDFEKMRETLKFDPRLADSEIDLDDDEAMDQVLAEAREMLTSRVLASGADA